MFAPLDRFAVALVTATPNDPSAGSTLYWQSPETTRILVHSVSFTLTTDANAADRRAVIEARMGSVPFAASPAPGDQDASNAWTYHFAPCVLGIDDGTGHGKLWAPMTEHLYLDHQNALVINILDIQATDQISDTYIRYYQRQPR